MPMQINLASLISAAIDQALKGNWNEAITLNSTILEKDPQNSEAKIRLGRAYIQTQEFSKAKKIFKEILEMDPVNPIALKNYKLATEKKSEKGSLAQMDPKILIKEPGTTTEQVLEVVVKGITARSFNAGEPLELKIGRSETEVYKMSDNRHERILVAIIKNELAHKLQTAKNHGIVFNMNFLKGEDKNITVLVKASAPIFKAEKQEVKPYIRKGSIDEPEMEIQELEETNVV